MKNVRAIAGLVALILGTGCASTPPAGSVLTEACPDWVNRDGGAFDESRDKLFATGAISNVQNIGLARNTADSRARANLQAILNTYVKGMVEDYARSTSQGDKVSEEQDILQAQRVIVEGTLAGSRIIDRCHDRGAATLYSLVVLDLSWIEEFVGKQQALNEKLRDHIRANARQALDRLDAATSSPAPVTN